MQNEAHDLLHELPEHKDKIHTLKVENNHFRKLFDEYHVANNELHRIEQGVENHADDYVEGLKKKRLHLKDQLFQMVEAA